MEAIDGFRIVMVVPLSLSHPAKKITEDAKKMATMVFIEINSRSMWFMAGRHYSPIAKREQYGASPISPLALRRGQGRPRSKLGQYHRNRMIDSASLKLLYSVL